MIHIDRRTMIAGSAAAFALAATPLRARAAASSPAQGWYRNAIVIDGLGGFGDPASADGVSRYTDAGWADTLATGVTVIRDTVFPVGNGADAWAVYQESIAEKRTIYGANPERFIHVRSAADILKAKRERKVGVIMGTQDTVMVGPEFDRLAQLKKDGVMTVQLTYNNANLAGDGAIEPRNAGLTKLGKATIERIEAEKLLLDLSHGGATTMAEAAAFAKRPLVISHSGARALTDHPRNVSDAVIRAVADKGGVVGVYFMPFLRVGTPATMNDVLAHIEHVANVAGEDHVGIGSDNGVLPMTEEMKKAQDDYSIERAKLGIAAPGEAVGVYPWVEQLNSVDRYWRVAEALGKRGWSQSRLEKLLGANFLRTYREAWGG
ncbi:MAG: membrane dipeptidase [Sphingomicrobium sp.]